MDSRLESRQAVATLRTRRVCAEEPCLPALYIDPFSFSFPTNNQREPFRGEVDIETCISDLNDSEYYPRNSFNKGYILHSLRNVLHKL